MVSSIDRLAFQHTLQVDNSRPGSYFFQPISPPFFFPIKWAGDSIESFLAVFLYIDSASSNLIILKKKQHAKHVSRICTPCFLDDDVTAGVKKICAYVWVGTKRAIKNGDEPIFRSIGIQIFPFSSTCFFFFWTPSRSRPNGDGFAWSRLIMRISSDVADCLFSLFGFFFPQHIFFVNGTADR